MSIEKVILPIKINEIVSIISTKKKLSIADAMSYLYTSNFYNKLFDVNSKWWYMSGLNLFAELEKEKKKIKQSNSEQKKEQFFAIFCVENYRLLNKMEVNKMDAFEVHALFKNLGVYDFLTTNYEVLHTQSEEYILNEISIYIKKQKKQKKPLHSSTLKNI